MTRSGSRPIGTALTLGDATNTASTLESYELAEDADGIPIWQEVTDPDQWGANGKPVSHTWEKFGGGLGKAVEYEGEEPDGGYYFSTNCYATPYGIKPAPTVTSVAMPAGTLVQKWFFEENDCLYCLADDGTNAAVYKIKSLSGTPAIDGTAPSFAFAPPTYYFASGSYTGDGAASKQITGLSFQPDAILIKKRDAAGTDSYAVWWTSTMTEGESKLDNANAMLTDGVLAATSDGFTVGAHVAVNEEPYTFDWCAWKDDGTYVGVGKYTGTGVDDLEICTTLNATATIDFEPDAAIVIPDATGGASPNVTWRTEDMLANESYQIAIAAAAEIDRIKTFASNLGTGNDEYGFTIGTDNDVNIAAKVYHFIVFKEQAGTCEFHTYAGTGAAVTVTQQSVFQPEMVMVRGDEATFGKWRPDSIDPDTDLTTWFHDYASGAVAGRITAINEDGFTTGSIAGISTNGVTYYYGSFKGASGGAESVGKPFKWNGKWRVPLGDATSFATLDTAAGAEATDTWTYSSDLKALHFAGLENKMARAHDTNSVSLCSSKNVYRGGNWGADYDVGEPGETITDIVEYGGELAVTTIKGLHFFDGVGYAQRKLAFDEDSENGIGMLKWYDYLLVPEKGGLHAWHRGASQPVGPDADERNQPWPNITGEVRHGRHYGLVGKTGSLWLYLVYQVSATENYIMTGKPQLYGAKPFKWDTLLSVDDTSKWLYAETVGPRLWWPRNTTSTDSGTGAGMTSTDTTLTDTTYNWQTNEWVGATVTSNGKTMVVTENTATVLTGASWSGGGNPGNTKAWNFNDTGPYRMEFITLKDDGSPEGGTYGKAAKGPLTGHILAAAGSFTSPEWTLPGKARFRAVETEIPGTGAVTGWAWALNVSIDRGGSVSLGVPLDQGFSELFWTPGSSDTGYSVRLNYAFTGGATFTPTTTPPEIRRITIHAMPIPDEGDDIVAGIDLGKGDREPETQMADLKAHIGSTSTVRNPITNELIKVNVYQVQAKPIKQKGNLPPAAVALVRMRRSDVS